MPDQNLLHALRSQGLGLYRVTLNTNGQPQIIAQPQQQNEVPGSVGPPAYQLPTNSYPSQPQQQPQLQQQQPVMFLQGDGRAIQAAPQPAQMYSVDVINSGSGPPITIYQAVQGMPLQPRRHRKRRRDPLAPKPARYAWNFFFKEHYKKLRSREHTHEHFDVQKAFTDIGANLGERWKALSDEDRKPYMELAKADKLRYQKELKEYLQANSSTSTTSPPVQTSTEADADADAEPGAMRDNRESDSDADDDSNDSGKKKISKFEEPGPDFDPNDEANSVQMTADILVTDDDEAFIFMITKKLSRLAIRHGVNLNIDTAVNGQEALKKVLDENKNYSVVTMDKDMGEDLDGVETIKLMREGGYAGCVLGVSASNHEEDFDNVGADKALQKGPALLSQVTNLIVEKIKQEATVTSTPEAETETGTLEG